MGRAGGRAGVVGGGGGVWGGRVWGGIWRAPALLHLHPRNLHPPTSLMRVVGVEVEECRWLRVERKRAVKIRIRKGIKLLFTWT